MSQVVRAPARPVLATARLRIQAADGAFQEIRVMCDSGAQANLLSESMFRSLKLKRHAAGVDLIGINEQSVKTMGQVSLELWHRAQNQPIGQSTFVIVSDMTMHQPQQPFAHLTFPRLNQMDMADPSYNIPSRVDGIIGVQILGEHLKTQLKRNSLGLLAQATTFGWIVFGGQSPDDTEQRVAADALAVVSMVSAGELYGQIKKLWEVDECKEQMLLSPDEQACEELFQSTVVREEDRYSVTLLLKPDLELGESRAM